MTVSVDDSPNCDGDNKSSAMTGSVRVTARGTFGDGFRHMGSFEGTYVIHCFVHQYEQLAAAGVVAGRLRSSDRGEMGVTSRRVTVAVTATVTGAGVAVEIGPLDVNLSGLMTRLEPMTVHLVPQPQSGQLCQSLLAAISPALARPIAGERVVGLLNALLTLLDPPGPTPAPGLPREKPGYA